MYLGWMALEVATSDVGLSQTALLSLLAGPGKS